MALKALLVFVAAFCVHFASSAVPKQCQSNAKVAGNPPLPTIPDTFSTTVEIANAQTTSAGDFSAYVSWKDKKISIENHFKGGNKQEIYDYNTAEKKAFRENDGLCKITTNEYGPFMYSSLSKDVKSIGDVFFFGDKYNLIYDKNTTMFRGIPCQSWYGCVNTDKVSLAVMFYFSKNATISGRKSPVLLASRVIGNVAVGNSSKRVSNIYNFADTHFEQPPPEKMTFPAGFYCPETKHSCQFPKIPDEFEMNSEVFMPQYKGVYNHREYVDTKEKYFRVDGQHKNAKGVYVPVHEIHDYNTGISYIIDSITYKCTMAPISLKSWDGVQTDDHKHIRMRNADEYFGKNVSNYTCKGNTTVRGIPAEVMVSSTKGNGGSGTNGTVIREWYFSQPGWRLVGMEGTINVSLPRAATRLPLKQVWYHQDGSIIFSVNHYNFDAVETTTHILWILRTCYIGNRHYMYFRLNVQFDQYGTTHQKEITNSIRDAVANIAGISKLRVSSILIFKSGFKGVIAVRLYVLGVPSIKGSVPVLHPKHQMPMKEAVKKIKTAIMSGKLQVNVKFSGDTKPSVIMKAQPRSYYDSSMDGPYIRPTTAPMKTSEVVHPGVSAGAVAGIAIVMFIIAIICTVLIMNFILKRRGLQLFNYVRWNSTA
eukprot:gene15723-17308_t